RGQFRYVSANFDGIARGPTGVDAHVTTDRPAKQRELLQECADEGLIFGVVRSCGQKYADTPHALLGARGERPSGRRTAKQCDELAPSHVRPETLDGPSCCVTRSP